jgi:Integrase zinc binding domain
MTHLHEFSHFGYMKTYQTAIKKVWWPNISGDFADFCSSCLVCQQIKRSPQEKYPLQSIAVANPLQCLMIDYHEVRQNPKVRESPFKYILILSDQMTQYVKLIATRDMTAQTTARIIMDEWILPFGCFRYLISDRGSSFLNKLFQEFVQMPNMKIFHYKTSPYHPQTNGLSEMKCKHVVRHLRAFCPDKANFHEFLPTIAAAANATYNSALGASSYFVLFGMDYVWPIDTALTSVQQSFREFPLSEGLQGLADRFRMLREIVHSNIKDARAETERTKNVHAKSHQFQIGQRVFVSQQLQASKIRNPKHSPLYLGPFCIVDMHKNLVKLQHYYSGKLLRNWINVSHLKSLRDTPRQELYNRYASNTAESQAGEQPIALISERSGQSGQRRLPSLTARRLALHLLDHRVLLKALVAIILAYRIPAVTSPVT